MTPDASTVRGVADKALHTIALITQRMSLEEAPPGYEMLKKKQDGCLRAAFTPGTDGASA